MTTIIGILFMLAFPTGIYAQKISLDEALQLARANNLQLSASRLQERYAELMTGTAYAVPKTQILADFGQVNSYAFDNKISVAQTFPFFSTYKKEKQVLLDEWRASKIQTQLQQVTIDRYVRMAYLQLQYLHAKDAFLQRMDSVYRRIQNIAALRHTQGESTILEKTTLDNEVAQIRLSAQTLQPDKISAQAQLAVLLDQKTLPEPTDTLDAATRLLDTANFSSHPYLRYLKQQQVLAEDMTVAEKSKLTPDLIFGYTNQSFAGWQTSSDKAETYNGWKRRFNSGQVGIAVPLFNKAQKNKIKASKIGEEIAAANYDVAQRQLSVQVRQAMQDYKKNSIAVHYFKTSALPQANIIVDNAGKQYRSGEINYLDWVMLMRNALSIESQYIDQLHALQLSAIQLQYLLFSEN